MRSLWRTFGAELSLEPELLGLLQKKQLQMVGQALCDLAVVCQRRDEMMWDEWGDRLNTEGPIPDEDFLAGLVQKSMFLDISGLVRQPKSRRGGVASVEDEGDSVAEEVTKERGLLLAAITQLQPHGPIGGKTLASWAALERQQRAGFYDAGVVVIGLR